MKNPIHSTEKSLESEIHGNKKKQCTNRTLEKNHSDYTCRTQVVVIDYSYLHH